MNALLEDKVIRLLGYPVLENEQFQGVIVAPLSKKSDDLQSVSNAVTRVRKRGFKTMRADEVEKAGGDLPTGIIDDRSYLVLVKSPDETGVIQDILNADGLSKKIIMNKYPFKGVQKTIPDSKSESFADFLGTVWKKFKDFAGSIKSKLMGSAKVKEGVVHFHFPDYVHLGLEEDITEATVVSTRGANARTGAASAAGKQAKGRGLLFELFLYQALLDLGLKAGSVVDMSQIDVLCPECSDEVDTMKKHAAEFAKAMLAHAQKTQDTPIDTVTYKGGVHDSKGRSAPGDIYLQATGYSVKYTRENRIHAATLSVGALTTMLGGDAGAIEVFRTVAKKEDFTGTYKILDKLIAGLKDSQKFVNLLDLLLTHASDTYMAMKNRNSGSEKVGFSQGMVTDFEIQGARIVGAKKGKVTVSQRDAGKGRTYDVVFMGKGRTKITLRIEPKAWRVNVEINLA